jgi:hypothetical protein
MYATLAACPTLHGIALQEPPSPPQRSSEYVTPASEVDVTSPTAPAAGHAPSPATLLACAVIAYAKAAGEGAGVEGVLEPHPGSGASVKMPLVTASPTSPYDLIALMIPSLRLR